MPPRGCKDLGVEVRQVEVDLSTEQGVRPTCSMPPAARAIDVLVANAGAGSGGAFLDQETRTGATSLDTNVTGTLLLIQPVLKAMVARGEGRVLIVGSIAGHVPGSFNAVYNGTKAFIDSFAAAVAQRSEGQRRHRSPASSQARPTPNSSPAPTCSTPRSGR